MSQEVRRAIEALNLNIADVKLRGPEMSILLSKIRSVTPSKLAFDLTEMRFIGCECEPPAALPYHVDFPNTHELCNLQKLFEAEQWLVINTSGSYNFYRYFCHENDVGRLIMRFAFAKESDAVLFKTAWY